MTQEANSKFAVTGNALSDVFLQSKTIFFIWSWSCFVTIFQRAQAQTPLQMLKGKTTVRWNYCSKKGKNIVWYIFYINKKKEIHMYKYILFLIQLKRWVLPPEGEVRPEVQQRVRNHKSDFDISSKHLCHWLNYFLKMVFKDVCFYREWDQSQASECLPDSKLWVWALRHVFRFCDCTQAFSKISFIIERIYQNLSYFRRHAF